MDDSGALHSSDLGFHSALVAKVIESQDYVVALQTLVDHKDEIDDSVLEEIREVASDQLSIENFEGAAALADLALTFRDRANPRTVIDLFILEGLAFHRLGELSRSMASYRSAIRTARAAKTIYGVPTALLLWGQLALQPGEQRSGQLMLRQAVLLAQQPDSTGDPKLLSKAVIRYAASLAESLSPEEATARALSLVVTEQRHLIRHEFAPDLTESEFDEEWVRSRIAHNFAVGHLPPRAMYEAIRTLAAELPRNSTPPMGAVRPSTSALLDRVMANLPITSAFASLRVRREITVAL